MQSAEQSLFRNLSTVSKNTENITVNGLALTTEKIKQKRRKEMKDLKTTKALVQTILEKDEKARNSDSYLYMQVLNTVAEKEKINLNEIHVIDFLLNLHKSPFPPFESVRRTRQKLQEKYPHLAPCKAVEELRAENEEAFLEFARS